MHVRAQAKDIAATLGQAIRPDVALTRRAMQALEAVAPSVSWKTSPGPSRTRTFSSTLARRRAAAKHAPTREAQRRRPSGRRTESSRIDVHLVENRDIPPAGGGETPIIAVAPAIANAIFAATGVRLRSMPLRGEALWPS